MAEKTKKDERTTAQVVDDAFSDLLQNIPLLRESKHYNLVTAQRDALKQTLKNKGA